MKNKRLIILLILLLVAIAIFIYDRLEDKILPIKLNVDKIEEVEILSDYWGRESKATLVLTVEEDSKKVEEIATLFNQSTKHPNQHMGTTHPTCVKIKYHNGKEVAIFCGVGNIITIDYNDRQYNYVNGELDKYITKLLAQQMEYKTEVTSEAPSQDEFEESYAEEEFISQRIVNYTTEYFRFTEDVQVDNENGKTVVTVTFVPEVGSIVIKEDLYENVAAHAYQITRFFPEVNHFYYIVFSQQYEKDEALYLTINEEAIKNLASNYLGQRINRNGGHETHFSEVFSEILETEESKTWRDRVDPNAELP